MALDVAQVRPPAIAGTFYPADPAQLTRMVDDCLEQAPTFHGAPKAIIAPHAGYVYSGPIAGSAWRLASLARFTSRRSPNKRRAGPRRGAVGPGWQLTCCVTPASAVLSAGFAHGSPRGGSAGSA